MFQRQKMGMVVYEGARHHVKIQYFNGTAHILWHLINSVTK